MVGLQVPSLAEKAFSQQFMVKMWPANEEVSVSCVYHTTSIKKNPLSNDMLWKPIFITIRHKWDRTVTTVHRLLRLLRDSQMVKTRFNLIITLSDSFAITYINIQIDGSFSNIFRFVVQFCARFCVLFACQYGLSSQQRSHAQTPTHSNRVT